VEKIRTKGERKEKRKNETTKEGEVKNQKQSSKEAVIKRSRREMKLDMKTVQLVQLQCSVCVA
jgi:hypothetical protein